MKKTSIVLCYTLLTGFSIGVACAHPVTVQVTGHVTQVHDTTGLISPNIQLSQPITAVYTYDTDSPLYPGGNPGNYQPAACQASLVVNIGSFSFQSGPTSQFYVSVATPAMDKGEGVVAVGATSNPPLANGLAVDGIQFAFFDSTGQWPASTDLPDGAPTPPSLVDSLIDIESIPNPNYYQIFAQIDSVVAIIPAVAGMCGH